MPCSSVSNVPNSSSWRGSRIWPSGVIASISEDRVELERAAQPVEAAALVGEPVRGVADTGGCIGRIGMRPQRTFEETARLIEHAFAEQGAPDLQHEIVIVLEAEREHVLETCERSRALSELEQHLA